jgi:hypothetical protein
MKAHERRALELRQAEVQRLRQKMERAEGAAKEAQPIPVAVAAPKAAPKREHPRGRGRVRTKVHPPGVSYRRVEVAEDRRPAPAPLRRGVNVPHPLALVLGRLHVLAVAQAERVPANPVPANEWDLPHRRTESASVRL